MKIRIQRDQPYDWSPRRYDVTVDAINAVWGEISKYGTKTMPDGRIWVIHGVTGEPLERSKAVPVASDGKGNLIYMKPGEKASPLDVMQPSIWKNP